MTEEKHIYPRVTEILKAFTSYEKIPQKILHNAATRGTVVHAICAGLANGAWIPDGMIDPDYLGYVNSFKKWSEAQVDKYLIVERRFHDDDLEFSGQIDFLIKGKDGELYLVDLKTTANPLKTHTIQMAAYEFLLRGQSVNVKGAMLVYLDKTGEFPEINLINDFTNERSVFMAALECYNYFNKGKRKYVRKNRRNTESANDNSDAEHLSANISGDE